MGMGNPDVDKKLNGFVHPVIRDLIGSMDVLSPSFHSPFYGDVKCIHLLVMSYRHKTCHCFIGT